MPRDGITFYDCTTEGQPTPAEALLRVERAIDDMAAILMGIALRMNAPATRRAS